MKTNKWKNFDFNKNGWSNTYENRSDAAIALARDMKSDLKIMLKDTGWELYHFEHNWFTFYGFFHNFSSDSWIYFSVSDIRWNNWYEDILIRKAKSPKDWTGGANNYVSFDKISNFLQNLPF